MRLYYNRIATEVAPALFTCRLLNDTNKPGYSHLISKLASEETSPGVSLFSQRKFTDAVTTCNRNAYITHTVSYLFMHNSNKKKLEQQRAFYYINLSPLLICFHDTQFRS